jgi:formate dehydrogenase major subunit
MTNHWIDIKNSDCILIMGSNAAENHPVSFKYVSEAMDKGATLISVDPRFTRTSSKADIYAPLRSGTDIAFLGGMIKHILDNDLYSKEYVALYTNAPFIVGKKYGFKDGLFSGYEKTPEGPSLGKYDKSQWAFEMDKNGVPKMDRSLKHRRSVFQLLKKHFSRYDIKTVSAVTGTPEADLKRVYDVYSATGERGQAGTIMYAMGWTQHTTGTQNIRTMAIIQLLLGNMGVAGGGVNALRGESNVQGSTDHCLLWHIWPGYLKTPRSSNVSLAAYNQKWTPTSKDPLSANWWQNYPKYSVSMLKSFFGDAADAGNDFGYQWLPKVDDGLGYSWFDLFDAMYKKEIKGFFAWGQNPACSGSNAGKIRQAMANLDWMVNVNLFDNETGSFWNGPGTNPAAIKTEVFMLPACASVEKEGSITNSGRWMQWRYQGPKPLGNSRPDGDIILTLGEKIKEVYKDGGVFAEPIVNLKWDYATNGAYDPHKVAKEINGYFVKDVTIKGKTFKRAPWYPVSPFCRPTAPPRRATGSTATATPKRATWPPAAGRRMRPTTSACIPSLPGAGRSTGASSTTGPPWMPRASPGTARIGWSTLRVRRKTASMSPANGWGTCRTAAGIRCRIRTVPGGPMPRIRLSCASTAMPRSSGRAGPTGPFPNTTNRWSARWRKTTSTPRWSIPRRRSIPARPMPTPPVIRASPMWPPPTGSPSTGRRG